MIAAISEPKLSSICSRSGGWLVTDVFACQSVTLSPTGKPLSVKKRLRLPLSPVPSQAA
jgi:hypothetical protein